MSDTECPHCGKHIEDLGEYMDSNGDERVFECPHCEKPIAGYSDIVYRLAIPANFKAEEEVPS